MADAFCINTSRIENPEIIAKLKHPNAELNDVEWVQALYTARQQTDTWIDAEYGVINGLLSEDTDREIFDDIDVIVREMPGQIKDKEGAGGETRALTLLPEPDFEISV